MNSSPASASGGALDLMALLQTAHRAQDEVESKLEAIDLSLAKLLALQALAAAGGSMPLSQLAARLSCGKSNVTQLIDRLTADGFVARQDAPHDRRTRLAVLTRKGQQACTRGTAVQRDAERRLLARLTPAEAAHLAGLLDKLHPR